jgi:hypothetical protein
MSPNKPSQPQSARGGLLNRYDHERTGMSDAEMSSGASEIDEDDLMGELPRGRSRSSD